MISGERTREILKGLHDAVVSFDEDRAAQLSQSALNEGVDPYIAVVDGLADGMREVGDLYERKVYFVPELLLCGDALYAGLNILRPAIVASGREARVRGSLVIGVMEGDIHDIGKNLVKVMFEAAGWTIHDLGRDVKPERFVEELARTNSEIVALSTLMTTSMLGMPKVIGMIRDQTPRVRIMVGGAPLNRDVAVKYGADGYADNASGAVAEATRLVEALRQH